MTRTLLKLTLILTIGLAACTTPNAPSTITAPDPATPVAAAPTIQPQTEIVGQPPTQPETQPEPGQPQVSGNPPVAGGGGPLASVAMTLGVSEQELAQALGDPNQGPPDLANAATTLGITEEQLATALGLPLPANNQPAQSGGQTQSGSAVLTPASNATAINTGNGVDLTQLPIGDYRVSNGPLAGYVWSCQTNFNGGGASSTGQWYNESAGTFDLTIKPTVDGSVSWTSVFNISISGDKRVFSVNDLPNHPTGTYPVSPTDDAYNFDRNPNSISAQSISFELPSNPTVQAQAACVGGEVGILLSGALLFNSFDAAGRDAVAHEIQDACSGHPQASGLYHYHSLTQCLTDSSAGHSPLMGYALDGFGIYGHHGENGQDLTNADLDECHGHTHTIEWDGQPVEMYHYHATYEFPYVIGCYRGARAINGPIGGGQPGGQGQPPQGGQGGQPPVGGTPPQGGQPPAGGQGAGNPPPPPPGGNP